MYSEAQKRYMAKYYLKNKDKWIKRRGEKREFIRQQKAAPCHDCGLPWPYYVMDFDHRPGEVKLFKISTAVSQAIPRHKIVAEIEKCDLVCANCHRIRTQERKQAS
jgi:hypothetical protein